MRPFFIWLLFQLAMPRLWAQLTITSGAQFYIAGPVDVTLHNTSLVNNGSFVGGQSTVHFTGNLQAFIQGIQPVQFYRMTVNKTGGSLVRLLRPIGVSNNLQFTAGLLDLHDFTLNLGTTGWLSGEGEATRTTTLGSGSVLLSRWVGAFSSVNPGNLGAVLNPIEDLGNITIRRGHKVQVGVPGAPATVKRYYDIVLPGGTSFDGTLRLYYLNAELNGVDENTMALYKTDGANWLEQSTSSRSYLQNYIEASGTLSGKRWAMANSVSSINLMANGSALNATQKKAGLAQTPAIGNLNAENNLPAAASLVRLWPNPATSVFFLSLYSENKATVIIRITDSKGALVKSQQEALQPGNNQLKVNAAPLPAGIYTVQAVWNNGQTTKAIQFIKQ